jgi:hypothetical protein
VSTKLYCIKVYYYDEIGHECSLKFYDLSFRRMVRMMNKFYRQGAHKIDTISKSK